MSEQRTPLGFGTAGLAAGLIAAFSDGRLSTVTAVLAGMLALLTAMTVRSTLSRGDRDRWSEPQETDLQEAELEEADDQRAAELTRTRALLEQAEERIRALEAAQAAAEQSRSDDARPEALTDPESLLFSEAYFRVALDARIASARRHLRPVAIALIDVFEGIPGSNASPAPVVNAAESIRQTVRDADTACRLDDGTYAVILEDTPENGAVWTVERIRRNLVSRFGSHTMWAGVACYPAHAFSTDELLDQARAALESAREWKQDRIEVAVSE
jgi:diguanylate cyclase (GGDEF)-like protein